MTRDEVIRMAREAGGSRVLNAMVFDCDGMLEQFAALVAAHEREECAKVCDRAESNWRKSWHSGAEKFAADEAKNCATAIRARTK